jgi:hypothetical protein
MALIFLPFVSILIPKSHELVIVSEEEEEQGSKGKSAQPGEEHPTRGRETPNFTQIHPHASIHIHAQTKST